MYEIGCVVIFVADLLDKLIWSIIDLLHEPIKEILPRYRARCFFQAYDRLRIAGDAEWNCIVLDDLMKQYGYI